jgi:hypothetical protein
MNFYQQNERGFSILETLISMTLLLIFTVTFLKALQALHINGQTISNSEKSLWKNSTLLKKNSKEYFYCSKKIFPFSLSPEISVCNGNELEAQELEGQSNNNTENYFLF